MTKQYSLYLHGEIPIEIIEVLFSLMDRLGHYVKSDAIQIFHLVVKPETNNLIIVHQQDNPKYEYKVKIPLSTSLKYMHYTICVINDEGSILDETIMLIDRY